MAYDNTNRGALFRVKVQSNENSPGYTGKLNVGGKDYKLSAWLKESKAGEKYFSLSVTPDTSHTVQQEQKPAESKPAKSKPYDDDLDPGLIPF